MPIRITLGLICLMTGPVACAATWDEAAALVNQPVELLLEDGRMPRGVLSPSSSDQWIVLQIALPDIAIESRFAMSSVRRLDRVTGPRSRPDTGDDFAIPPAPRDAPPMAPFPMPGELPDLCRIPTCPPDCGPTLGFMGEFPPLDRLHAPRSLHITATVANWDADPEMDGLLLRVVLRDGWGRSVAADGHLDAQLVTETRYATGGRSVSRNDTFQTAERWTVPMHAIDFDADGAVVQLPFRRIRPEQNFDMAPDALVVARLRVPTAGVLDASDLHVTLRPGSRFRDDAFLPSTHR